MTVSRNARDENSDNESRKKVRKKSHSASDIIVDPNEALAARVKTVRHEHKFFLPIQHQQEAIQLAQYIVDGKRDQVKAMLKTNPSLLAVKITSQNRELKSTIKSAVGRSRLIKNSGKIMADLTAVQIALCEGDDDMVALMQPYFDRPMVKDGNVVGQAEFTRQFTEIFPKGIRRHVAAQEPYSRFDIIVDSMNRSTDAEIRVALRKENNSSAIGHHLKNFRIEIEELSYREKVFNPQHLQKALEIFSENYAKWDDFRRDLFWRQIIGYVQRFLPMCYKQSLISELCLGKEYSSDKLQRNETTHNYASHKEMSLLDLDNDANSRLGFDVAIYNSCLGGGAFVAPLVEYMAPFFKTLVEGKNQACRNLKPQNVEQVQMRPVPRG